MVSGSPWGHTVSIVPFHWNTELTSSNALIKFSVSIPIYSCIDVLFGTHCGSSLLGWIYSQRLHIIQHFVLNCHWNCPAVIPTYNLDQPTSITAFLGLLWPHPILVENIPANSMKVSGKMVQTSQATSLYHILSYHCGLSLEGLVHSTT